MNPFYRLVADRAEHRCEYCRTETRLFNPRQDNWNDHFQVMPTREIIGKTAIGRVTIIALNMNHESQIFARGLWIQWNLFP